LSRLLFAPAFRRGEEGHILFQPALAGLSKSFSQNLFLRLKQIKKHAKARSGILLPGIPPAEAGGKEEPSEEG
jgi:hypothetical protein